MTQLKRCPFCGGEAETKKSHVIAEHQYWIAYCYSCGARSVPHSSEEGAIEAWNTRPNPWHTGTPTEEGWYLTAVRVRDCDGSFFMEYEAVFRYEWGWHEFRRHQQPVVAWQKITTFEGDK